MKKLNELQKGRKEIAVLFTKIIMHKSKGTSLTQEEMGRIRELLRCGVCLDIMLKMMDDI